MGPTFFKCFLLFICLHGIVGRQHSSEVWRHKAAIIRTVPAMRHNVNATTMFTIEKFCGVTQRNLLPFNQSIKVFLEWPKWRSHCKVHCRCKTSVAKARKWLAEQMSFQLSLEGWQRFKTYRSKTSLVSTWCLYVRRCFVELTRVTNAYVYIMQ